MLRLELAQELRIEVRGGVALGGVKGAVVEYSFHFREDGTGLFRLSLKEKKRKEKKRKEKKRKEKKRKEKKRKGRRKEKEEKELLGLLIVKKD